MSQRTNDCCDVVNKGQHKIISAVFRALHLLVENSQLHTLKDELRDWAEVTKAGGNRNDFAGVSGNAFKGNGGNGTNTYGSTNYSCKGN